MKKLWLILICFIFIISCTETYERKIASVYNDKEISGSFLLGSGYINEREYYFAFVKREDGGLIRANFPANVTIIYEGYQEPYAIIEYYANTYLNVKLYVPSNTIIKEFKIR